jgi:hypothetical protein
MQHIKDAIHHLINQLQVVLSHLELEDYKKAHRAAKDAANMAVRLAKQCAEVAITVPEGGGVVVPKGTRILHHEDVNVDVAPNEVRSVTAREVRDGFPHKRKYKDRGPTMQGDPKKKD